MSLPDIAMSQKQELDAQTYLDNGFFDLKIPREKLLEKFDARVLSDAGKKRLGPILDAWKRIAEEKEKIYASDKSEKQPGNYFYINPFSNLLNIIKDLKNDLKYKNNYYIVACDKTKFHLQALASVTFCQKANRFVIGCLATHPNNIRSKFNKERISGAASRVILEIEGWAKKYDISHLKLYGLRGSRTFYQHIGFQPAQPPFRLFWVHPITEKAKINWIKENQEYVKDPVLNEDEKTEESSEEELQVPVINNQDVKQV